MSLSVLTDWGVATGSYRCTLHLLKQTLDLTYIFWGIKGSLL